jgi:hypothetical protein
MASVVAGLTIDLALAESTWFDPDGNPLPFTTDEEVLDFLSGAEIVWKEKLTAGTNKKKRKVLLERDGVRAHAIHRTGYEVKYIAGGGFVDSYESEIAAYKLNRLLGQNSVPPVIRRKGGSLQLWIEKATTEASRLRAEEEPADPVSFENQLKNMRIFDNLIANTDRNPGNILIDSSGKVWFIDHTRSFAGQEDLRYPDAVTGCDEVLWQRLRQVTDGEISAALKGYVGSYMDSLLDRRQLLVDLIKQRIKEQGESNFLFVTTSN